MRTVFIVLLSILSYYGNIFPKQDQLTGSRLLQEDFILLIKKPYKRSYHNFLKVAKSLPGNWNVRAIISPHAGYVFSGKIAASAFSSIPKNAVYKNIFIIGSSHIMAFDGASVYNTGDYITPLGKIKVNREIADKLINENKVFNFPVNAHIQEHSIEVQLPFIQYYFKETP